MSARSQLILFPHEFPTSPKVLWCHCCGWILDHSDFDPHPCACSISYRAGKLHCTTHHANLDSLPPDHRVSPELSCPQCSTTHWIRRFFSSRADTPTKFRCYVCGHIWTEKKNGKRECR
jgi:hypothetical protein